jgi:cellulose synthase/poly-beta-1,6-N-acetylglucosamine synthase-like glycosyltransferase
MLITATIALMLMLAMLGIIVVVFALEIAAGILREPRNAALAAPGRMTVVVPAHNESTSILPTIRDVQAQLRPQDHLLVVADNCSDDTGDVARGAKAAVIVRNDPSRVGKGYALDFAISHLSRDPPDVLIIIDADCTLSEGALQRLGAAVTASHRPAQALYLMIAPERSRINLAVAEFAWRIKNLARPLGLNAMNLPCQLVGSGMAFPWKVIRSVNLASDEIVEDLKLGIDLATMKHFPEFCPSARIESRFASTPESMRNQRNRWEHGHLSLIAKYVPLLVYRALERFDFRLLTIALDLAVPPLVLLTLLLGGSFAAVGLLVALGGTSVLLGMAAINFGIFVLAIAIAWIAYGRDVLPVRTWPLLFCFFREKISVYRTFFSRSRTRRWIKTGRD